MKTKKLVTLALLTAAAMILSYVEALLPSVAVPGVKMGLANIAVVFTLYKLGWREAAAVSLVRVALVSLLFGNLAALAYSLAGAVTAIGIAVQTGLALTFDGGLYAITKGVGV